MDAVCPSPHPHGARYRLIVDEHAGELRCPWCDWQRLMHPVPGQYVFHRDIDPWVEPNTFAEERVYRRNREDEINATHRQRSLARTAAVRHASL